MSDRSPSPEEESLRGRVFDFKIEIRDLKVTLSRLAPVMDIYRTTIIEKLKIRRTRSAIKSCKVMLEIEPTKQFTSVDDVRRAMLTHPDGENILRSHPFKKILEEVEKEEMQGRA